MKRTATPTGYVVSLLGSHSAFTAEGILIGRYERKTDALVAQPTEITELRSMISAEMGTDAATIATVNAMNEIELNEWVELLTV